MVAMHIDEVSEICGLLSGIRIVGDCVTYIAEAESIDINNRIRAAKGKCAVFQIVIADTVDGVYKTSLFSDWEAVHHAAKRLATLFGDLGDKGRAKEFMSRSVTADHQRLEWEHLTGQI
jgi:hypothetical protein